MATYAVPANESRLCQPLAMIKCTYMQECWLHGHSEAHILKVQCICNGINVLYAHQQTEILLALYLFDFALGH